ncbi:TonB-dependent receptor domain-containing protein [Novosphingobium aquae]|uniref:TonB-dependent receptor n=1 Tax=Novosphingobium aquae TaxID=3133435 RepID=A0ABU8S7U4_9SPHN
MLSIRGLAFASVSLLSLSAPAFAQDADETEKDEAGIVVVGTLIRGTEVTGSQTLSVDAAEIAEKGAVSTNELLGLVPQISNAFNGRFEVDPRGVGTGLSINRPNLRNLPGANSASGGTALVLVDGFRMAPMGVNQSSIDVDVIPSAVIAGLDIVTDGGSSLYGADAVSGVINFRTLRKFEGIKVDLNYGKGDTIKGYSYWDGALTVGKSWATGNAYISASYAKRESVLNNETTWYDSKIYNAAGVGTFTGTQCDTPQQTVSRWFRFGAGSSQFTNNPAAPGAGTFSLGTGCDALGEATYSPEVKRYNVYAAVTQEFGENIDLRVTGYWAKRDTILPIVPRGFTSAGSGVTGGTLVTMFPAAAATTPGTTFQVNEGVGFRFTPNAAYVNTPNTVGFETWGVTPELTVKMGSDWQVKTTAHYGRSDNYQSFPSTNTVLAQCYITGCAASGTTPAIAAGQLNPLNVAAASAAVITDITDFTSAQQTKQSMFVARVVADGPIFPLPGGDAKVAVGLEYQSNKAQSRLNAGRFGAINNAAYQSYSRNSKSAFGEVSLPVMPFLDLSASLRYDDYSDFGSTTNPSLGAAFKPTEWLKIYGHWSKSFNAPTAVDGLGIATGRFALNQYVAGSSDPTRRPSDPAPANDLGFGTHAMILDGTKKGTRPQTSESWAVGFEVTPNSGLNIGAQFYSIDFKDILAAVNPQNLTTYTTNPELYYYNTGPTTFPATYAALLAQLTNASQISITSDAVAFVVDRRTSNIGTAKIEGVDFHIDWRHDYDFGQVSAGISGNKQTKALTNFGVAVNELPFQPAITAAFYTGVKVGGFSTRVTVNYTGKFTDPNPNNAGTSGLRVNPFTVINLAMGYEFGEGTGALEGTSLRLGIDNLFEEKPQTTRRGSASFIPYTNWTIGRVFKIGASKKF